jgi:hypothetical protein
MTANNYVSQQDLLELKSDVLQLMSVLKSDNDELKQSQQSTLNFVREAQKKAEQQRNADREKNAEGGPIGSSWVINDPARIQEYRASKAAVDPADYYDCKTKILVDYYGRQVSQNTLPIWSCEGDNPEIAIDRENAISRLAYPLNTTMEEQLPYNNNFRNLQLYPTTSLNQSVPYGLGL